mgnify:CR=1 FL=1
MKRPVLLVALLVLCRVPARADAPDPAVLEADYQAVRAVYKAHHYEQAARAAEALLKKYPDCGRCAHLLGKSYGRLAQRANWLSAECHPEVSIHVRPAPSV